MSTPRRKRSRNASAALQCRTRLQQGKIDPMSTTQRHDVALAFGALVRELRTAQGLTQEGLAERGGFHRTYPSLLERGLRTPTLSVLFNLRKLSVSRLRRLFNARSSSCTAKQCPQHPTDTGGESRRLATGRDDLQPKSEAC